MARAKSHRGFSHFSFPLANVNSSLKKISFDLAKVEKFQE
jgi:hypothetical protein